MRSRRLTAGRLLMKKHFIALLSMMMCFVLSVGIFTACDTETEVPKKYTISFYDGDELVDTIETYGNEEISMPAAPKKEDLRSRAGFRIRVYGRMN